LRRRPARSADAHTSGLASDVRNLMSSLNRTDVGIEAYRVIEDLYPICRSITGDGLRATLRYLTSEVPLELVEVPTGTKVLDWSIPREWNIVDAYVKDSSGRRVIDFRDSNLHVVNYSVPVNSRMRLGELSPHLHTLPDHPGWIPYRTSYYNDAWGFCLSQLDRMALEEGEEYDVCIDSSLTDGHLTYGEYLIRGETDDEVLISTHACHPSLCNDNLSGVAVASRLAKYLSPLSLRYSYRFLFIPGTIGAITWLARNRGSTDRIKHGLVLACLGDRGSPTYKRSRRGDAEIDRAACHVLEQADSDFTVVDFSPDGYDERQYCSPAFDLPVGCLTRTPWGRFPEYHTSADNLELVDPDALADSFFTVVSTLAVLEENRTYLNLSPAGEPQLGSRGLYRTMGGGTEERLDELALRWVLNLSDGCHSLLDIAARARMPFTEIGKAADALLGCELLREAQPRHRAAAPRQRGGS
jgi:aminopeptidase-like protein